MSLWRQLTRGLRVLTHRAAADRDVTDEVQHYLDEATDAFVARGLTRNAARRAATLELGNVTVARERIRAYGWENLVGALFADVRYGARRLRRSPGFTLVTVLTLAVGIGATTTLFSAVKPILIDPLPYPQAGRIMTIWDFGGGEARLHVTFGTYRELVERSRSFDALAVSKPWQPTFTGRTQPERLDGQRVSAEYFRVLGVSPALGHGIGASDDRVNGPDVVVISHRYWRRLGADTAIVGHPIELDGRPYTVVGVMPAGFENIVAPSADTWTALQYDQTLPPDGREWGHHLTMIGRLREGLTRDAARHEVDAIAHAPMPQFARPPHASLGQGFLVRSLQDDVTGGVRPALVAVLGAVLLVLAIACVNVTNLLLARGAQRRGEFAMRAALGAGRSRLVRQLLTESLILATLGGTLGLGLAEAGVRALAAVSPPGLPREGAIVVDWSVFAFAALITAVVGLAVGVIPALHAAGHRLHSGIAEGSRRSAGGHQLTRRTLVVAEVALAIVLLVGTGLLLRSTERLFAVDPGFDTSQLLAMQVQTGGSRFSDPGATHRFFDAALEAVRQIPGVSAAAFTSQLPLSGGLEDAYGVHCESSPTGLPDADSGAYRYAVSAGYFETMGLPLRRGRVLDAHDAAGAPPAVLISESLARSKFRSQDPVGQRLRIGPNDSPWYTIAGVVGDVKQTSLAADQSDAVYITTTQWSLFTDKTLWLVARARGDVATLAPLIKHAIWSVDKDQPVVRVATMNELVAATAAERRFALILFEAFALVALVLAAVGIYGVLSGAVTERTREIGVRAALGASRAQILALVLRQGMTLTGLGAGLGLGAAMLASRAIATLLFGVSRLDPVTYVAVVALLVTVSGMACALPAWRAARVDPAITLRAE